MRLGPGWEADTDVGPVINRAGAREDPLVHRDRPGRGRDAAHRRRGRDRRRARRGLLLPADDLRRRRAGDADRAGGDLRPDDGADPGDGLRRGDPGRERHPFGLSSSIFTRDVNRAFRAMRDLETGITYVNAGTIGAEVHLPFGGTKDTGNGHREAGQAALDVFTEWKSLYVDYSGKLQRAQIDVGRSASGGAATRRGAVSCAGRRSGAGRGARGGTRFTRATEEYSRASARWSSVWSTTTRLTSRRAASAALRRRRCRSGRRRRRAGGRPRGSGRDRAVAVGRPSRRAARPPRVDLGRRRDRRSPCRTARRAPRRSPPSRPSPTGRAARRGAARPCWSMQGELELLVRDQAFADEKRPERQPGGLLGLQHHVSIGGHAMTKPALSSDAWRARPEAPSIEGCCPTRERRSDGTMSAAPGHSILTGPAALDRLPSTASSSAG